MDKIIDYNGSSYIPRNANNGLKGYFAAMAVSSCIMAATPIFSMPLSYHVKKNGSKNNALYKDYLYQALSSSGLKEKGVSIVDLSNHIDKTSPFVNGTNAAYNKILKQVWINTEKFSVAGFHELGHAMDYLSSSFPKLLVKLKRPGICIAGLMEFFAIFSRKKPKEADSGFLDTVENNCGKIAFVSMLPLVAEEALASCNAKKLAEKVNMPKNLIKDMRILNRKALLTYAGRAGLIGLSVGAARMVMDSFTRPKKINSFDFSDLHLL